jgi:integrase/recombinase XerD
MTIPAVKLVVLDSPMIAPSALAPGAKRLSKPSATQTPVDLRWSRVSEFLRSRELRPNTNKAYEREFKAFPAWTDKGWQDITARDIDRYKAHLKSAPSQRRAASINLSLSALQSIFKWLCARDYIGKDPMLLIEKLKPDPILPKEWSADEVRALFEATTQRGESEPRDRALL